MARGIQFPDVESELEPGLEPCIPAAPVISFPERLLDTRLLDYSGFLARSSLEALVYCFVEPPSAAEAEVRTTERRLNRLHSSFYKQLLVAVLDP